MSTLLMKQVTEAMQQLQVNEDDLLLQENDNPGSNLVNEVVVGRSNYVTWSWKMTIALEAKGKLGFVNGKCEKPKEDSEMFSAWVRVDAMVWCWILNSISKDLHSAAVSASSAKDLWDHLEKSYGVRSPRMLSQIMKEFAECKQGDLRVDDYFMKLCKLWNALACSRPLPKCSCGGCEGGASDTIARMNEESKLMQFLMGLNDAYSQMRIQILFTDPLTSVHKAYSMISAVETTNNFRRRGNRTQEAVAP